MTGKAFAVRGAAWVCVPVPSFCCKSSALGIGLALRYVLDVPQLFWPGTQEAIDLGIWYIPIAIFLIVGASNAVNFTDGMDGLAGLISATAFAAFGSYCPHARAAFLGRFCFTLVGALFGFLWFNVHPAQLFMGDTGSLASGCNPGSGRVDDRPMDAPSVDCHHSSERSVKRIFLQIVYFKITKGKRLFKMAPCTITLSCSDGAKPR